MKKRRILLLPICLLIVTCSRQAETGKVFTELYFVDHQNLRYVTDENTLRCHVNVIKQNMDRAALYGVHAYLFFAKETFEAMLSYNFEIEGMGNIGEKAFPIDGEHRRIGKYLRAALKEVLEYAKGKNLRVFFHTNQFVFPDQVLQIIKPAVWGTAVCPGREITWEIYRKKLHEFLTFFPDIAGIQVTGDETQVSVLECRCDFCKQINYVDRVNVLTQQTALVCELHSKEVQMRTWQRMGELENELHPSKMADGLPANVFFSIKNTKGDFHLTNPVDMKFLNAANPNRIVVEFDAWREYDGNNYFPCYMCDLWAPRLKLLKQLGVKRIAIRLNWNSNKNQIFERPWGNMVNIYCFLKLAKEPTLSPDAILTDFIRETYPASAHKAAFELYKFSPKFQRILYYLQDEYCANHSKVQDEDAAKNLNHIMQAGFLTRAEHFKKRRDEIESACNRAYELIDRLGTDVAMQWRQELIDGVKVERFVAVATLYKMEILFSKERHDLANVTAVQTALRHLQKDWKKVHPESYQSMNGDEADLLL